MTTTGLTALEEAFRRRWQKLAEENMAVDAFGHLLLEMLHTRTAVEAARELVQRNNIDNPEPSIKKLQKLNRLDLTIEHVVANESQWTPLFDIDLRTWAATKLANWSSPSNKH